MSYEKELTFAKEAARTAGLIQLRGRSRLARVSRKSDDSPVTVIDRECENSIRKAILSRFPSDGFLGEETGSRTGTSGRTWIVDPLDGTRPYIRDIPTHSVLIALAEGEEPVVGVLHLPAMGETYWARKGGGAFRNGTRIHVSSTRTPGAAIGSGFGFVEKSDRPEGKKLLRLMKQWDYAYGFMDVYSYACVASGKLDVCVNLLDKPWDCAAAACVVAEAGGRFSDIHGRPSVFNGSIVLSNGILHSTAVRAFGAPARVRT
jgi:histidinol-phosphatase